MNRDLKTNITVIKLVRENSPLAARHAARVPASRGWLLSCVRGRSLSPGSGAAGSGLLASAASASSAAPSSPSGRPDG
jgi:hypothetical protein